MAVAVAAAVMLLAACGGGDGSEPEPAPSGGTTTQASITAPPTLTPEEQAEADIQATFEDLIAAWDDFKANASDYTDEAADPAWNFDLVESEMRMLDEAQLEFLNSTNAFLDSGVEQVGRTVVATIDIGEVELSDDGSAVATGDACLDLSGLSFNSYDGAAAELPTEPGDYQRWVFVARYVPNRAGWFISTAAVDVVEACV